VGGKAEIKEDGGEGMGEFLGWASYDLEMWCDGCKCWYDREYQHEHQDCEEEQEDENEN